MSYPIHRATPRQMDYLLIALGGFLFGGYLQSRTRRGRRRAERHREEDGTMRQADAFLRGIRAFERGVTAQIERDRRAARLRRLVGPRTKAL